MKKRIVIILVCISLLITLIPTMVYASSNDLFSYSSESDNTTGVAVHIKSKTKSFISGKVKVTYYVGEKKIQSRVKNFTYLKNNYVRIDGPDDSSCIFEDDYNFKVKVYNVKKVKKTDAKKKLKTWIKRKSNKDGYSDDVVLYIKNTSKKPIKYRATLVMRYDGEDAFGDDCTGQIYDLANKKGTIKPGKTIKVKGMTWSDYKLKSSKFVDAYY